MKVSLNTLKSLVDVELPPVENLVDRINSQLGGVEEIINLGEKYKDAKIVKIINCEKHQNADKLTVCQVDVGSDDPVQVVCGAPNAKPDMWAVWLPPNSVVPSTFDDENPFRLDSRKIRGVLSHGMLAAGDELAINDNHEGIVELVESDLPSGKSLEAGASFAEVFGLDDTIIDIENKMFTHRPDLFGQLGVAREVSAIVKGLPEGGEDFADHFTNPDWYTQEVNFDSADGLGLDVFNHAPENSPRFMAVAMSGVNVAPSPMWLQTTLLRWGSKPINNVVDLTNYIMLLTGQPTHAYDYAKLRGEAIGVRMATDGEKITLLNGKEYTLGADDIVIADGEGAIGLGGIMGGFDSEVTDATTDIVLEVATFDMYTLRRSSMRYGLFTDALTRFNKGQSFKQNHLVMNRLMGLMSEIVGANQSSSVFDKSDKTADEMRGEFNGQVGVKVDFINSRLGLNLSAGQIAGLLNLTNFDVEIQGDDLTICAPFWRTDISLPEDIVEEVGRLYGFDKLPRELPRRSTSPVQKNPAREVKQKIRQSMSKMGANEILSYSFVHENVLKNAEQNPSQAFRLSNALSPDLQYYRLSVLPSLLDKVHMNIRAGHDEFVIFEIGKGHDKSSATDEDGLPVEKNFVDAVYASKNSADGAPYFKMKKYAIELLSELGLGIKFTPANDDPSDDVTAPFDPARGAKITTLDGEPIGTVGELKQSVIRNFKLPKNVAAMTLDFDALIKFSLNSKSNYKQLSRYPSTWRDISLRVASEASYAKISDALEGAVSLAAKDVDFEQELMTIYRAGDTTKTFTFRLKFTSYEKTLTDKGVTKMMNFVEQKVKENSGAEVV